MLNFVTGTFRPANWSVESYSGTPTPTPQGIWGARVLKAWRHYPWRGPVMAECSGRAPISSLSYGKISCYLTWLRPKTSMHVLYILLPLADLLHPSTAQLHGVYTRAYTLQGITGNLSTIAISVYCKVLIYGWVNRGIIVVTRSPRGAVFDEITGLRRTQTHELTHDMTMSGWKPTLGMILPLPPTQKLVLSVLSYRWAVLFNRFFYFLIQYNVKLITSIYWNVL